MPRTRLFIYIDDQLDERLRKYLNARFKGHVHGKITQVVIEALESFLDQQEQIYGETKEEVN